MNRFRFRLRERLADFREWIDERSPWRFELVLLACLLVGVTVIIWTAFLPALHGFTVGKPAPRTIVAGQTVTVLDADATDQAQAAGGPAGGAGLPRRTSRPCPRPPRTWRPSSRRSTRCGPRVAGSTDTAAAVGELKRTAPATASPTRRSQYLLTADAIHLRSPAAPGAGRAQDGVRRPHHRRHHRGRAPESASR